jgi:hypothetical protein
VSIVSPDPYTVDKSFRSILAPFMGLAAIGFILSVAAHLAAIVGSPIPFGKAVWALHIGIFVVWLPTVLVGIRFTRGCNRRDYWKVALAGCPKWIRTGLYLLFGYAMLNFIVFIAMTPAQSRPKGDAPPEVVRGFSGHWMVFYGAAFATLYSASVIGYSWMDRKCRNGHSVPATAKFCEECGVPLGPSFLDRSA